GSRKLIRTSSYPTTCQIGAVSSRCIGPLDRRYAYVGYGSAANPGLPIGECSHCSWLTIAIPNRGCKRRLAIALVDALTVSHPLLLSQYHLLNLPGRVLR